MCYLLSYINHHPRPEDSLYQMQGVAEYLPRIPCPPLDAITHVHVLKQISTCSNENC